MPSAPALFVSHGSPAFALEPGELGPQLAALGATLNDLAAICIVSAHWQTSTVRVGTSRAPETIHDFRGFPDALYQLRYPVAGTPELAEEAQQLLKAAGFQSYADKTRGLDHGAWVPLRYLKPLANVPVFQVSMPDGLDAAGALRMGAALAALRDYGVLVVGSGSLTHNLYEVFGGVSDVDYATEFVAWIRKVVAGRNVAALINYRIEAPHAVRAHPTEEHFLPLVVAFGASGAGDTLSLLDGGMSYGVLSMDSFLWSANSLADQAVPDS